MTCIVGVVSNGKITMGGDSAAVHGWTSRQSSLKKVFRRGPFLIGYTSSFRMGQLLQYQLLVGKQKPGSNDLEFLVCEFVEALRKLFKDHGFAKIESNSESAGQFLVGYRGHLYSVQSDFQVAKMGDAFDAVGSGAEYALGALQAMGNKAPAARRVKQALQAAAHFSLAVRPPFVIRSMTGKS